MDWIVRRYPAGFCLTFVRSVSADGALDRLGVDPQSVAACMEDEAVSLPGAGALVRAGRIDDWAFALESESSQGGDADLLAVASRGTVAVSLTRVATPMTVFLQAEQGVLVTMFDVTMPQLRY